MVSKKQIFVIFANGHPCMVTTSPQKVKHFIIQKILSGIFDYGDPTNSRRQQVLQFKADWKAKTRDEISEYLVNGSYTYYYDGEEFE